MVEPTIAAAEQLRKRETIEIERDQKTIVCSTQDPHFDVRVEDGYLFFHCPRSRRGSIRPLELLTCLGLAKLLEDGTLLQRTAVLLDEPHLTGSVSGATSQSVQPASDTTDQGENF